MTVFGIIWIFFLLLFVFRQEHEKIIFMVLFASIFQCSNVLVYNDMKIGPFIITSIILVLYNFFVYKRIKISKKVNVIVASTLLLFLAIIVSIIYNYNSISNTTIIRVLQLLCYILCFFSLKNISSYKEINYNKMILKIIDFVLIIGIFQFLCSMGIIPKNFIFKTFIYNDVNESSAYYATTKLRLYSTFMEPSYCASFLIFAFCYIIMHLNSKKNNIVRLFIALIEIALTFSTTAYIGFAISIMLLYLFADSTTKKKLSNFFPLLIIGFVLLASFGFLDSVILKKSSTASASTRELWNKKLLNKFNESPIFGVGYKTNRASSLFYQIIGELGLFGLLSYAIFILAILKKILKDSNKTIAISLLSVVFCQLFSIPDLDFCVFWFIMYIFALSNYKMEEKENG